MSVITAEFASIFAVKSESVRLTLRLDIGGTLFIYLLVFAEKWLAGVYMCQGDTCEITSLLDHPFKSYAQKSKCSIYVYHCMTRIRFLVKS